MRPSSPTVHSTSGARRRRSPRPRPRGRGPAHSRWPSVRMKKRSFSSKSRGSSKPTTIAPSTSVPTTRGKRDRGFGGVDRCEVRVPLVAVGLRRRPHRFLEPDRVGDGERAAAVEIEVVRLELGRNAERGDEPHRAVGVDVTNPAESPSRPATAWRTMMSASSPGSSGPLNTRATRPMRTSSSAGPPRARCVPRTTCKT